MLSVLSVMLYCENNFKVKDKHEVFPCIFWTCEF